MNKTQKYLAIFFLWAVAHVGFFLWYQFALQLEFSWIAVLFIFLVFIEIFLLTLLFRSLVCQIIFGFAYALFLLYAIVNFAYFDVFGIFLRLNGSQLSQINFPLLFLLKDFYVLIPWYAYLSVFFLLIFFVAYMIYFRKKFTRRYIQFQNIPYNSAGKIIILKKVITFFVGVIIIFIFTFSPGFLAKDVAVKAYKDSFSQKSVYSDLGISGYIFLATFFLKHSGSTQAETIQEIINEEKTNISYGDLPKSDLQLLRGALGEFIEFSPVSKKTPKLPSFLQKPNIIIYQMEAISYWPLLEDPSPMPFLERAMQKYQTVGKYFANGCTTIDAEFSINCSFFPDSFGPVSDLYSKNTYNCLPNILKEVGYETALYHSNNSKFWNRESLGPAWGYDKLEFMPIFSYRQDDRDVLEKALDELTSSKQPMLQYIIGMSSHAPHNEHFQKFYKNSQNISIESYQGSLSSNAQNVEINEDETRLYFGFLKPVDEAIKYLFGRLEEEGLKDNTIVIIFGDHRYYNFFSGDLEADFLNYNRIPLLFYIPGVESGELQPMATHLDIAPTLLQLIQGKNVVMPETFLGQSIFSQNYHPYMLNACLGQALYYNEETLIKGDIGLNVYQTAIQKNKKRDDQEDIAKKLGKIMYLSDYLLKTNQIGDFRVAVGKSDIALDFDQITDSDHDGLSDLREKAIGTDPKNPDTDGDGYLDGVEVLNGWNPLVPEKSTDRNHQF